MCGTFVISESESIATATTLDDLDSRCREAPVSPYLAGNFRGSSTLPSIYLDGCADIYGATDVKRFLNGELVPDSTVTANIVKAASLCVDATATCSCSSKKYKDKHLAQIAFASGEYSALFGYSESM